MLSNAWEACRRQPALALLSVYLFGNLLLPITSYAAWQGRPDAYVDVLGNALPYGPWLNRALFLGLLVLLAAVGISLRHGRKLVPHWLDATVLLWLIAPAVAGWFNGSEWSADWLQSLYLTCVWGAPYLAVRMVASGRGEMLPALVVCVIFGLASFIGALPEFCVGRFWYTLLVGYQPYVTEGPFRYFGYRPLLMFEDPNQIGMWWATVAIAALAVLRIASLTPARRASLCVLISSPFWFQAVGASLLTIFGMALYGLRSRRHLVLIIMGLVVLGGGAMIMRGPLLNYGRRFTQSSPLGAKVKSVLRDSSIGSFGWRLGLEESNAELMKGHMLFGRGSVNYWQAGTIEHSYYKQSPKGPELVSRERVWGLLSLISGAYGLVGCAAWIAMMLLPIAVSGSSASTWSGPAGLATRAVMIILLLQVIDASMNSAYLLPCMMLLGLLNSQIANRATPADVKP